MPVISVFFGIIIRMYYAEHNPPHFHVHYNEFDAIVSIQTLELTNGHLPARALAMVLEWANLHRAELMDFWNRAQAGESIGTIDPLM